MGKEIVELTGLRGLACACVWLVHNGSDSPYVFSTLAGNGRVGVTVFFVLSGFLMGECYKHCNFPCATCSKAFWVRRAARVCPLYYLSLMLSLNQLMGIAGDNTLSIVNVVLTLSMLQAWFPFNPYTWNGVTWTLSVEAFCYLLFPLAVNTIRKRYLTYTAVFTVMCVVPLIISALLLPWIWYDSYAQSMLSRFPLLRCFDFLLGVCAASWEKPAGCPGWLQVYGSFGSLVAWLLLSPFLSVHWHLYNATGFLAPLCAWVVFVLARYPGEGPFAWLLGTQPVYLLGKISYAFYLLHTVYDTYAQPPATDRWVYTPTFWCASVGLGAMAHLLVEQPLYSRILRKFSWRCECTAEVCSPC